MKIGVDGSCLSNRRGFGRFARQLLSALAGAETRHRLTVFVDTPSLPDVSIPEPFATHAVDVSVAPSRAASARGRRSVPDLLAMGRAVAGARLDLMFFPATYSFFPVWNCPRVVVTVHDTLALSHPDLVFPSWKGRLAWTLKEHAAIRWADRVLTVSQASRRDVIDWFRLPSERVGVLGEGPSEVFSPRPEGTDSDAILARYGITPRSRFLLYVGGLSPHKNLARLIDACARLGANGPELILVGDLADVFHTHVPALRAAIARHGLEGRVRFAGFVPDEELAYLYSRAYALVQPSLLEGFGLPPVEALACGTPVLYSRAGSLPEVVGDAGVSFDPRDVAGIAAAIRGLCDSPALRHELAGRALRQARRHTWVASARALLDCFDSLDPAPAGGIAA